MTPFLFCYRYKSKKFPQKPSCIHQKSTLHCTALKMQDIHRFHPFIILKHTSQHPTKRSRAVKESISRKTMSAKYYIKTEQGPLQVCCDAFTSILGISKTRAQRLSRMNLRSGLSPKEIHEVCPSQTVCEILHSET